MLPNNIDVDPLNAKSSGSSDSFLYDAATTITFTCRICLDDETDRSLVLAPCSCAGSQKWVHRACLDRWRATREDKAFSQCTECLAKYKLVSATADNPRLVCWRRCQYSTFLLRDFAGAFLLLQFTVLCFAYFAYGLDGRNHYLASMIHLSPQQSVYFLLFYYYILGLLLLLSMIGVTYSCSKLEICQNANCPTCYCNDSCCLCPYYFGSDTAATGATAAVSDPIASSCCCQECSGCLSIDCGQFFGCAGVTIGEECFICLAVLVVVFAVIGIYILPATFIHFYFYMTITIMIGYWGTTVGVLVSVVLGAAFVQYITQKHVHILHKWNLARDYVVQDLAPTDFPKQPHLQLPRRGNEGSSTSSMGIELPFQRYGDSTKSSDGDAEEERENMLLRGGTEDPFRGSRSLNPMQYHETSSSIVNRRERSSAPNLSSLSSTRAQAIDRFDLEANLAHHEGEQCEAEDGGESFHSNSAADYSDSRTRHIQRPSLFSFSSASTSTPLINGHSNYTNNNTNSNHLNNESDTLSRRQREELRTLGLL